MKLDTSNLTLRSPDTAVGLPDQIIPKQATALPDNPSQWPPTLRYIAHGLEFNGVSHTDSLRIVRDAVVKALPQ